MANAGATRLFRTSCDLSLNVATLAETGDEQVCPAAQAADRQPQFPAQLGEILTAAVRKLATLEQVPDPLIGVELGCVAGQPLQVQPLGRARREEVLDRLAVMDGCAVP